MKKMIGLIVTIIIFQLHAQVIPNEINNLLDKINLQSQKQETLQKSLGDYKYTQFIHFIKMDGDGEIDEQSKREYTIYVKSDTLRKRELISALEYEDSLWTDITDKEKNSSKERHSESKSFSLSEMFGPKNRKFYNFEIKGEEFIDTLNTIHMIVTALEEDEDRFQGNLWFETNEYTLVKAELKPSDMPTFVDDMQMFFDMQKVDSLWFPKKIVFNAEVGILFLFSGKIHSEILFSDFEFNQQFDNAWFNSLENAE
jgi:hypothetical protein